MCFVNGRVAFGYVFYGLGPNLSLFVCLILLLDSGGDSRLAFGFVSRFSLTPGSKHLRSGRGRKLTIPSPMGEGTENSSLLKGGTGFLS